MGYGSSWAYDQSRYGSRHRWQRKRELRDMHGGSRCARCGELLIPEEFRTGVNGYRVPRGWISRNIHLDHVDGSDTWYNGLVHASCNSRAHRTSLPRTDVPPQNWRLTREEFEAKERWHCESLLANHLTGYNSRCAAEPCWQCARQEVWLAEIESGLVWKKQLRRRRRYEIRKWDSGYRW